MGESKQSAWVDSVERAKRAALIAVMCLSFAVGVYGLVYPAAPTTSWSDVQAEFDKIEQGMTPEQRKEAQRRRADTVLLSTMMGS